MIKIIDTYVQINDLFDNGKFVLDKWKVYMNSIYDNAANLVIDDMKECLDSGDYVYEKIFCQLLILLINILIWKYCILRFVKLQMV